MWEIVLLAALVSFIVVARMVVYFWVQKRRAQLQSHVAPAESPPVQPLDYRKLLLRFYGLDRLSDTYFTSDVKAAQLFLENFPKVPEAQTLLAILHEARALEQLPQRPRRGSPLYVSLRFAIDAVMDEHARRQELLTS